MLIISPLISLMESQISDRRGTKAARLSNGTESFHSSEEYIIVPSSFSLSTLLCFASAQVLALTRISVPCSSPCTKMIIILLGIQQGFVVQQCAVLQHCACMDEQVVIQAQTSQFTHQLQHTQPALQQQSTCRNLHITHEDGKQKTSK